MFQQDIATNWCWSLLILDQQFKLHMELSCLQPVIISATAIMYLTILCPHSLLLSILWDDVCIFEIKYNGKAALLSPKYCPPVTLPKISGYRQWVDGWRCHIQYVWICDESTSLQLQYHFWVLFWTVCCFCMLSPLNKSQLSEQFGFIPWLYVYYHVII